jgi:hypothetical protein
MLGWWNHALVDFIEIRVESSLPLIDRWDLRPELLPTLTAPITHVKRHDLASGRIHRQPEPLLVHLLLHNTPHLIGFGVQSLNDDISRTGWELDVQVIRRSREALNHEVQEPRETDAHRATDPAQGNTLAQ